GEEKADGRAKLGKHSVECAAVGRRVFDGEQDSAAPFTAEADALSEAEEREQQRRGHADGFVRRQRADEDGRSAHGGKREDEGGLAADAVAEVSEQRRADGSRDEGDAEGGERSEPRGAGVGRWEEERGKDEHRGRGVDVEVEELNGGAHERGEEDGAR